jgi:hypothetical protein
MIPNGRRKYSLALLALIVGSIALLLGKIDGGAYNVLVGAVLSLYGTANVFDKMKGGDG